MLRITRRDFLKYCSVAAGALGLSASTLMRMETAMAKTSSDLPIIWIAGAACTGCTTSLLNTINFASFDELLLNQINLVYLDTVMGAAGAYDGATKYPGANALTEAKAIYDSGSAFVLIVEGAIPTGTPTGGAAGDFCRIGDLTGDPLVGESMFEIVKAFAAKATYILALGTCASFGGIPAAKGNKTAAQGLCYTGTASGGAIATANQTNTRTGNAAKTFNVPGCPPHPDWILGSIAALLAGDLSNITTYLRPRQYYGQYQCNAGPCPWRFNNTPTRHTANSGTDQATSFTEADWNRRYPIGNSKSLGVYKWGIKPGTGNDSTYDPLSPGNTMTPGVFAMGCLGILGCKGRKTKADCSARRWNADDVNIGGVNWCVGSRGGCHGCTEPTFPDKVGKFYTFV